MFDLEHRTINITKFSIISNLLNQSIGILGIRIKKIPPTLTYNLNNRTVVTAIGIVVCGKIKIQKYPSRE
jgi:hypothetical protein